MAKSKPQSFAMQEGSAPEEAAESPQVEAQEQAAGQNDHPVVHRPRASSSPYPV